MNSLATHLVPEHWRAPAEEPSWLMRARQQAWQRLETQKLPTTRLEDWKYTGLDLLARRQFTSRTDTPSAHWFGEQMAGLTGRYRMVFVDGYYAEEFSELGSTQDGLDIAPLSMRLQAAGVEAEIGKADLRAEAGFTLLATARFKDGAYIAVEELGDIDGAIDLVYICTGDTVCHQRNIIRLGNSARLEVAEHFISTEGCTGLTNHHLVIDLGAGAELDWVRVQRQDAGTFLVTRMQVQQHQDAKFNYFGMDTGSRLVRHDIHSSLLESGAEVRLTGVIVVARQQHVDNHTHIEHIAPDCTSTERFKAVAAGRSRVVFNGKIKVHPGADGTNSNQSSANLLLSAHAEIDTKPELEIYADDVVATHGATVGQLDETAVYYLRSRGLSELEARQLLIRGFCRELVDRVARKELRELLDHWLNKAMPEAGVA